MNYKVILQTTGILLISISSSCCNQSTLFKKSLKQIENRKWIVSSLKYHTGQEIKTHTKHTKTCAFFEIRKVGKYYRYQTDDCCNSHEGIILIKSSHVFLKTRKSSLAGCFPEFNSANKNKSDSLLEQEKLLDLSKKWVILLSAENDTLSVKLFENELKIWNRNKDTATLILNEEQKSTHTIESIY